MCFSYGFVMGCSGQADGFGLWICNGSWWSWTSGGCLTDLGLGWVDPEWGLIWFLVLLRILLMVVGGYIFGWQLFRVLVGFGCDCL